MGGERDVWEWVGCVPGMDTPWVDKLNPTPAPQVTLNPWGEHSEDERGSAEALLFTARLLSLLGNGLIGAGRSSVETCRFLSPSSCA